MRSVQSIVPVPIRMQIGLEKVLEIQMLDNRHT